MNDPLLSVPSDAQAELRLIGLALQYPAELAARFCAEVSAADFEHSHHALLCGQITELHAKGIVPDLATVAQLCADRNLSGAMATAVEAATNPDVPSIFDSCVQRVTQVSRARNAMRSCLETARRLGESSILDDTDDLVMQHADALTASAGNRDTGETWMSIPSLWLRAVDEIEAARNGEVVAGSERMPYGIPALDRVVEGGERGRLLVIGAQRHVGKTALARAIACEMGMTHAVGWFGMESSAAEEGLWTLAYASRVPLQTLRKGMAQDGQFTDVHTALTRTAGKLRLHLDDTPDLSVSMVSSRARALKRRSGLDVLLVDYVQLLSPGGASKNLNREQMVSEDARRLKVLARQLNIHIVALAQVNDECGPTEAPEMRHFRESKALANHADSVVMMSAPDGIAPEEPGLPTARDLWIRKWRGVGAQSRPIPLLLHGSTQRFTERAYEERPREEKPAGNANWKRRSA